MVSNDDTLAHTPNDAITGTTSALPSYTVTISTGGTRSSTPSSGSGNRGNNINLHGGRYTITSVCNHPPHESSSQNQPKPTGTRTGQDLSFGPEGSLAFNKFLTAAPVLARGADIHSGQGVHKDEQSLKRSDEVSTFWNTKIQACQSIYNRAAGLARESDNSDLEFAVMGTLVLNVEDARLGRMSVIFPGVGFGLATLGSDGKRETGKWWFGGPTFEYMKEGQANTVRALGSDREGRARYFYFSPSFKEFGSDCCEMEAGGGGDIVLTRIYGH
ncbi:hypothetical protein V8F06_013751 [Rhypophila decipiens]